MPVSCTLTLDQDESTTLVLCSAPAPIAGTNTENLKTGASDGVVFLCRLEEFQSPSGKNLLRWDLRSGFVMQWANKDTLCIADWLYKCSVQKLVVVISNIESGEVLERWQFDIECDKTAKDDR